MIDKLVEEQIKLYLRYSKDTGISMKEYIKIRQQAIKELNMGVIEPKNASGATSTSSTTNASDVLKDSINISHSNKKKNISTNTENKVININENENRKKEEVKEPEDDHILQLLKSVKE